MKLSSALAVLAIALTATFLLGCPLMELTKLEEAKVPEAPSEAPSEVPSGGLEIQPKVSPEGQQIVVEDIPTIVSVEINESEGDFPLPFD